MSYMEKLIYQRRSFLVKDFFNKLDLKDLQIYFKIAFGRRNITFTFLVMLFTSTLWNDLSNTHHMCKSMPAKIVDASPIDTSVGSEQNGTKGLLKVSLIKT